MSYWPIGINFNRKFNNPEIIFVGDAMGLANPVTGEGIFYAIASGCLAGEAIIKNDSDIYYNAVDSLFKKRKLSKIFSMPTALNIAVSIASKIKFIEEYLIGEISNINTPLYIF